MVVSTDSDCPDITLNNFDLQNHQIAQRVSDQFIDVEKLAQQLHVLKFNRYFILQCFGTRGCDFNPFLKHISQYIFAVVAVKYGAWLSALSKDIDKSSAPTDLLAQLSSEEVSTLVLHY